MKSAYQVSNSIKRVASQDDGRLSHLHLTPEGVSIYEQIMPRVEAVLRCADQSLSRQQQARLNQDLHTLMDALPDNR